MLSRVRFFTTPWTAAYQAPPFQALARKIHGIFRARALEWSAIAFSGTLLRLRIEQIYTTIQMNLKNISLSRSEIQWNIYYYSICRKL